MESVAFAEDYDQHDHDIFKDSSLRFFGYTNELGEAFRPLLPRWIVTASYGVAMVYATSDTIHKAQAAYKVRL